MKTIIEFEQSEILDVLRRHMEAARWTVVDAVMSESGARLTVEDGAGMAPVVPSSPRPRSGRRGHIPPAVVVEAVKRHNGNCTAAARELGIVYQTAIRHYKAAGFTPQHGGRRR